jgi:hypothetical protein
MTITEIITQWFTPSTWGKVILPKRNKPGQCIRLLEDYGWRKMGAEGNL